MQNGILKEQGTDYELREKNGIYNNLCRIQDSEDEMNTSKQYDNADERSLLYKQKSLHNEASSNTVDILNNKNVRDKEANNGLNLKKFRSQLWSESWKYRKTLIIAIILSLVSGFFNPIIGLFVAT